MAEPCCVVNQLCEAPANGMPLVGARATCFSCGRAVCAGPGCSVRSAYLGYGVRRICYQCIRDRRGDHPTIEVAWRKMKQAFALALGTTVDDVEETWGS